MSSIRKIPVFIFILCLCVLLLPAKVDAMGGASDEASGKIWFIPIRGDIEPSLAVFVRREARRALSAGAEYLVFEIDTFGGRVDTALQITSFITSINSAATIAWVNSSESSMGVSWSAGALIAFSCDAIYMAPGTSIGAAAPVISGPTGTESADEKSVAAVRSQTAALAERNGYPAALALAMVDYDVELGEYLIDGEIHILTGTEYDRLRNQGVEVELLSTISSQGKLLSLTAGEALQYGLSSGLAPDRNSLIEALNVENATWVESNPSTADAIISILSSSAIQTILILIGLVLVFLEIQSPGFGIPGIIAVIAFIAVFVPGALLGRLGSLEIILFVIGLGMLAVELFILPGFGIIGISGFLMIGVSLVLSMQDFVIPRFEWEWLLFGRNVVVVLIGLFSGVFGIAAITLFGPKLRLFNWLVLDTKITGTAGGSDPHYESEKASVSYFGTSFDEEDFAALLGKTGIAETFLRPSGKALIHDRVYPVETEGDFIEAEKEILVTRIIGNRIIVKKV